MSQHDCATEIKNYQFKQITPLIFKFRNEILYDRNIWRMVIKMIQYNPATQWKFIVDFQITELFDQIPVYNQVLEYLCLKNHHHLIEILIRKDTNQWLNFNYGLQSACQGGHREIIQMMVNLGAREWNRGLSGACEGGFKDLVRMMIDLGARDWNNGLWGACREGHRELVQMMINYGADDWNEALQCAYEGGHRDVAQMMVDDGGTETWMALRS